MAYGFLFFWALWIDTINSAFQAGGFARGSLGFAGRTAYL
jgi:hypothetical protein